jgi:membrane-associated phospholipid phosphatase
MSVSVERRSERRGYLKIFWDLVFRGLRWSFRTAHSVYTALGIFLVAGIAAGTGGTYLFVKIAGKVRGGKTEQFDRAVLEWFGAHHTPFFDRLMLELTVLGTWIVVLTIVGIAGLFLFLTRHRVSAALLGIATLGGIALNNILKISFERPRPSVIEWQTTASSWSFPSGHAMSAVVMYGTVAYLAARLHETHWARVVTLFFASVYIGVICVSRLYLGVHYPSDVLAGVAIGLAWAGFCMATLEALQVLSKRNAKLRRQEEPAPKDE